jgi:hypothetical protein
LVIIFVLLAIVSFISGLSHAPLTANVIRHFGEILLSILLFLVATNSLRTARALRLVVGALIVFGFVESILGIILYFLPPLISTQALSALQVVGYPAGQMCCATSKTTQSYLSAQSPPPSTPMCWAACSSLSAPSPLRNWWPPSRSLGDAGC